MNYYNEHDSKAAAWLRALIDSNLIPAGDVDERGIEDVRPEDLRGYTQCHFFAGIGGWSYALQLAGWPADRPVWTGSCPCQPFSTAGKGLGTADARHLWPVFAELIRACKPPTVFGEQVASKAGRDWLAGVFADLEGMGYQRAGADLCAAGVGAPHIRQRLFWVADSNNKGLERWNSVRECPYERTSGTGGMDGGMADSKCARLERSPFSEMVRTGVSSENSWGVSKQHVCRDGKTRRIPSEPALFPLADGLPGRVGLLRGAGNAIVPQVAAEFIKAFLEVV